MVGSGTRLRRSHTGYADPMTRRATTKPTAGKGTRPSGAGPVLLGLGLGAFVDGIVMHQILQWHHLVSGHAPMTTVAGLELNTLADGFFQAAALLLVAGGVLVLLAHWRQGRLAPSWSRLGGLVVVGLGLFNVADSVVNHWLLGTHHVRDDMGAPLFWDIGFFVLSVAVTGIGWLLARRSRG